MSSQSSSQEMDCSEPCSQDVEERSLNNTVEMTSAQSSLESNMDLSESLQDGNEDGSDDQDDSSHSDTSSEGPPSQLQSPVSFKVSHVEVQVKTTDGSQEVSSDYGSQEDASCQTKSPITVKIQTTSTNGSQEVTADNNNGSQEFVLKSEMKICLTMSRENSTEKQSNLKRKSDGQEEEVSKEKKSK